MPELKRITPEEVLEAFVSQALKPERKEYFPHDGCACGLGAIAKKQGLIEYSTLGNVYCNGTRNNLISVYGESYHNGFARGFDDSGSDDFGEAFAQGYEDGQAAWEAVKHLALSE
jgi:hypothetical protein